MSRDLLLLLEDIEKACAKIGRYAEGLSRDEVFADEMRFDGILHNLQVIGEAVKKVPEDYRRNHPAIAWREIAGNGIAREIPDLLNRVRELIETENESRPR